MSDNYTFIMSNLGGYVKNQYKQLLGLLVIINLPYISIKILWDNKINTLFYIFLGLLVFIRIFSQTSSSAEKFKQLREKNPTLSKQKIVKLVERNKNYSDASFFICLIILIFSFLLV